jgi:hypothetical protein
VRCAHQQCYGYEQIFNSQLDAVTNQQVIQLFLLFPAMISELVCTVDIKICNLDSSYFQYSLNPFSLSTSLISDAKPWFIVYGIMDQVSLMHVFLEFFIM